MWGIGIRCSQPNTNIWYFFSALTGFSAISDTASNVAISGSIFHNGGFICAPWSRKAYTTEGGVHNDWTMADWRCAGPGYTHAETLADMLGQIRLHLAVSPGTMA